MGKKFIIIISIIIICIVILAGILFIKKTNTEIKNYLIKDEYDSMARGHIYLVEIDKDIIDFNINRRYS